MGQRKEKNYKKKKKKNREHCTKVFRSELLNYRILPIPFVKHPHGVT